MTANPHAPKRAAGACCARAALAKDNEVLTLLKGGMGATELARTLKIGRASVYRILENTTAK